MSSVETRTDGRNKKARKKTYTDKGINYYVNRKLNSKNNRNLIQR